MRNNRTIGILSVLVLVFMHAAPASCQAKLPNIMIILVDDMGYSDPGCYGGEIETPHLDQLAANGIRYTQFYNTGRCWPTRSAIFSGYYPQQMGIDPRGKIAPWVAGITHKLKKKNYRNYHSGKWHLNAFKTAIKDAGFDHSYRSEGFNRYFSPRKVLLNDKVLPPREQSGNYYATTAMTDYMLQFLQEHEAKFSDQPFFAYLAYIAPHFPLHALPQDIAKYRGKYDSGWNVIMEKRIRKQKELGFTVNSIAKPEKKIIAPSGNKKQWEMLGPGEIVYAEAWKNLTPQQQKFQAMKMEIHAAMVHRVDIEVGRVISQLKEMKVFNDTLILFLSDNGASAEVMVRGDGHDPTATPGTAETYLCLGPGWGNASNTPFRRYKIWNHEGGISTPLIAHWPQGIRERGVLRKTRGHVVNLVPTLLEMAGLPLEPITQDAPPLPGRSLVPSFNKEIETLHEEPLYFSHSGNRGLIHNNYKIVSSPQDGNVWELYDLDKDRGEMSNLADTKPDMLAKMIHEWETLNSQFRKDRALGAKNKKK